MSTSFQDILAKHMFSQCCKYLEFTIATEQAPDFLKINFSELLIRTTFDMGIKRWNEEIAEGVDPKFLMHENRWQQYLSLSKDAREISIVYEAMCDFIEKGFITRYCRSILNDFFYLGLEEFDHQIMKFVV